MDFGAGQFAQMEKDLSDSIRPEGDYIRPAADTPAEWASLFFRGWETAVP